MGYCRHEKALFVQIGFDPWSWLRPFLTLAGCPRERATRPSAKTGPNYEKLTSCLTEKRGSVSDETMFYICPPIAHRLSLEP